MIKNKLIKYKLVLFALAYVLFFVSWFIDDVAFNNNSIQYITKFIRFASYGCMALELLIIQREKEDWIYFSVGVLLGLIFYFNTSEIYIIILIILIMISIDIPLYHIFRITFITLSISVIVVLVLCAFNFTENIITFRGINGDFNPRYSLGFYHSNVLPLLFFYLTCYVLILYRTKINCLQITIIFILNLIIYILCDSRTSFYASNILIIFHYIYFHSNIMFKLKKIIYFFTSNIFLILTIFSITLIIFYANHNSFINYIDATILSGRLSLGYQKILSQGLNFLAPLSFSEYSSDLIVVDNGYLSVLIRYGIFFMLIMFIVNKKGMVKYKNDLYFLQVFLIVATVNFIDNDLLSYSFYPFILALFNSKKYTYNASKDMYLNKPLISVIMSTYNETEIELKSSIDSILAQSYKNLEFIIVNDNPQNLSLNKLLNDYQIKDSRIILIKNEVNIGLVRSLNKAIKYTKGTFVARMDADDIADEKRLSTQLKYLIDNNYDFVGSYLTLICDYDLYNQQKLRFPYTNGSIKKQIGFGNCIPHPTWLLKKDVYMTLNGYRDILYCEDYDFILRALKHGFLVGNVPAYLLKYRIRETGISKSNDKKQKISRYYLSKYKNKIDLITQSDINKFIENKDNEYYRFENIKNSIKEIWSNKRIYPIIFKIIPMLKNKYFYYYLIEKTRNYIYQ